MNFFREGDYVIPNWEKIIKLSTRMYYMFGDYEWPSKVIGIKKVDNAPLLVELDNGEEVSSDFLVKENY